MTAPRRSYDVVVIGGDASATVAAALLARRGFRVSYVRHDARPSAYAHAGLELLRKPAALTHVDTPAWNRVLAELALTSVLKRRVRLPEPLHQVVLPSHRIDVSLDGQATSADLAREFPEVRRLLDERLRILRADCAALDAVFDPDRPLPPDGFLERRAVRSALAHDPFRRTGDEGDPLAGLPPDHAVRDVVASTVRFATGLDPDVRSARRTTRAYGLALRGGAFVQGGRDALERALLEKVVQHGGELRERDRVARILTHRGRVSGVQLATTDETIGCSTVVSGLDAARTAQLLAGEGETAAQQTESTVRWYRYVMSVVVPSHAVPVGMAERVFAVADRARPLAEENLLAIERAPADAHDRVVLTVSTLLPRAGVDAGSGYLRRQRGRVLVALGAVIPFVDRHVLLVDCPYDGAGAEDRVAGVTSFPEDRWNGAAEPMDTIDAPPAHSFLGVSGLSIRSAIAGLWHANAQVLAGLGDEGEWLAATSVARAITRRDPVRARLRRELWIRGEP